jgi:hypothetical protein
VSSTALALENFPCKASTAFSFSDRFKGPLPLPSYFGLQDADWGHNKKWISYKKFSPFASYGFPLPGMFRLAKAINTTIPKVFV